MEGETATQPEWRQGNSRGKPFQKGDPRIWRKGRVPIASSVTELLKWAGALDCPEEFLAKYRRLFPGLGKKLTLNHAATLAMYAEILKGNVRAFEIMIERTEGKVTQPIQAVIRPGRPVEALSDAELAAEVARLAAAEPDAIREAITVQALPAPQEAIAP